VTARRVRTFKKQDLWQPLPPEGAPWWMQPRTLAGELPAESVRLIPGEFFKGRFELRSTTPVASNCQVLLEKRPVVPLLLCCIVRWSTAKSDQTLHRRTGNAAL